MRLLLRTFVTFKFNTMLDFATAQGNEAILLSDLNCCFLPNKHNDSDCKQLKSIFHCFDFSQLIDSPTRTTQASRSLIDLIAVNCPQNIRG